MHPLLLVALPILLGQNMQDLIGQQPKPFIEPEGFYAVILPANFDCSTRPRHVECKGNIGVQALLTIDVVDVPKSATVELVFMNQLDKIKKQPHYRLIQKGKTLIDGAHAITAAFSYDYLGNVEYSVGVQALYMVRGGKEYVIHFESRLNDFRVFARELAGLYASFKPARLDASGNPILEELARPPADSEQLPDVQKALNGAF